MADDVAQRGEPVPPVEVWVIAGEEGHVYGIEATEMDAWEFVAREARTSIWECADDLPESLTCADEIELFWLIRSSDRTRERVLMPSHRYPHGTGNQDVHGYYHLHPIPLPVVLSGGDAAAVPGG